MSRPLPFPGNPPAPAISDCGLPSDSGPWTLDFGLWTLDCGLRTPNHTLMAAIMKLPAAATQSVCRNPNASTRTIAVTKVPPAPAISDCGLPSDSGPWTLDFGLWTLDCGLRTPNHTLMAKVQSPR